MASTTSSGALQLFALLPSGPRELGAPVGSGTVHDVLETLPGGVYSAMRTFEHDRFLWLDEHLARTERSMRGLGWNSALRRHELCRALDQTARAYPGADARVRFDVLREPVEFGGVRSETFIALSPLVAVPEAFVRDGVRVDFAPHLHRDAPRIKTTEFVRVRKPLPIGTQERYEHILVDATGRILECSSANIAFLRGRELVSAGDGVLQGITMMVIEHLAPALGLRVVHERLAPSDLAHVDEALLSSSARGIVPIVRVAEQPIGSGAVGPHVRRLLSAYAEFAARNARRAVDA
jgi:branched-subunit amino acid aminotransferase/4-amino-4-deoxychorismate lyase